MAWRLNVPLCRSEVDDWRRGPPPETRTDDRDRDRGRYNGRDSSDRDRGGGRDREGGRGFSSYEPPRDRGKQPSHIHFPG